MQSATTAPSWKVPTRLDAAWFRLHVWGHVGLRAWRELRAGSVERHRSAPALIGAQVVAERRSPLWQDGRGDEFALVAGKVENLRIARRAFDGVVVPAGAVLSFWKQLGRPTRSRGFVEGREIRAGCVVPVIAGGLCQLSNALAARERTRARYAFDPARRGQDRRASGAWLPDLRRDGLPPTPR